MLVVRPPPDADRFVIVAGDHYDSANRSRTPRVLAGLGTESVQELWALLVDWDISAPTNLALMEPVKLTVCFLQDRVPIESVGLKSMSVSAARWGSVDRALRTSELAVWLAEHGVDLAAF